MQKKKIYIRFSFDADVSYFWCCLVGEEEKWIIQSSTSISHCITSSHEQFQYSSSGHRSNPEAQCFPKVWYNTSAQIRYYRDAQAPPQHIRILSLSIAYITYIKLTDKWMNGWAKKRHFLSLIHCCIVLILTCLRCFLKLTAVSQMQKFTWSCVKKIVLFCVLLLLLFQSLHSSDKMLGQSWCAAVVQWPLCSWGGW